MTGQPGSCAQQGVDILVAKIGPDQFGQSQILDGIRRADNFRMAPFTTINDAMVSCSLTGPTSLCFRFSSEGASKGYANLEWDLVSGSGRETFAGWFVVEIGLLNELRKRGIGIGFYRLLLSRGLILFSGVEQTPSSMAVWRKLLDDPSIETRVLNGRPDDPWADPDSTIMARARGSASAVANTSALADWLNLSQDPGVCDPSVLFEAIFTAP